jgi:hypothetical protein
VPKHTYAGENGKKNGMNNAKWFHNGLFLRFLDKNPKGDGYFGFRYDGLRLAGHVIYSVVSGGAYLCFSLHKMILTYNTNVSNLL